MLQSAAVLQSADRQKRLLRQIYDEGWSHGVGSYEPDDDPAQTPQLPRDLALAGLTGAALLAAQRGYPFTPPLSPDPVRRAIALYPAFNGVNHMASQLMALVTSNNFDTLNISNDQEAADWAASNAYRLDAGASVAWAGEQAGYAEAANADGMYLYNWVSQGDQKVCPDCEILSSFPPMPLGEWPTSPGAGDTECNAGCRCTWDTWGLPPTPDYTPDLTEEQQALTDTLSERQVSVLQNMTVDAAYLD